jgi:hypothetical protein
MPKARILRPFKSTKAKANAQPEHKHKRKHELGHNLPALAGKAEPDIPIDTIETLGLGDQVKPITMDEVRKAADSLKIHDYTYNHELSKPPKPTPTTHNRPLPKLNKTNPDNLSLAAQAEAVITQVIHKERTIPQGLEILAMIERAQDYRDRQSQRTIIDVLDDILRNTLQARRAHVTAAKANKVRKPKEVKGLEDVLLDVALVDKTGKPRELLEHEASAATYRRDMSSARPVAARYRGRETSPRDIVDDLPPTSKNAPGGREVPQLISRKSKKYQLSRKDKKTPQTPTESSQTTQTVDLSRQTPTEPLDQSVKTNPDIPTDSEGMSHLDKFARAELVVVDEKGALRRYTEEELEAMGSEEYEALLEEAKKRRKPNRSKERKTAGSPSTSLIGTAPPVSGVRVSPSQRNRTAGAESEARTNAIQEASVAATKAYHANRSETYRERRQARLDKERQKRYAQLHKTLARPYPPRPDVSMDMELTAAKRLWFWEMRLRRYYNTKKDAARELDGYGVAHEPIAPRPLGPTAEEMSFVGKKNE